MQRVSVWLITNDEDKIYLSQIIRDLAEKYNAPLFHPHLTAFGGADANVDEVIQVAKDAVFGIKPFKITVDKLNYTEYYFQTVKIEFKNNDLLNVINQRLAEKLTKYGDYTFRPHISLIYKKMSEEGKKEVISSLNIKNEFTISGIVVMIGDDAPTREGVESWRVLYRQELM